MCSFIYKPITVVQKYSEKQQMGHKSYLKQVTGNEGILKVNIATQAWVKTVLFFALQCLYHRVIVTFLYFKKHNQWNYIQQKIHTSYRHSDSNFHFNVI
jgi:hypothetical protein